MKKLLIRMQNGGVDRWWKDAIVRVLYGGNAPDLQPGDVNELVNHRKWMKENARI